MEVSLLKWESALRADLVRICNQVDRRYLSDRMPFPYTESDADSWLAMIAKHDGTDGLFRAVAVDGEIVGTISFEPGADVYRRSGDLGYFLLEKYCSQGIMSAVVSQFCPLVFSLPDVERITAYVYAPNLASRRVLEKNGFSYEGTMKRAVYKDGRFFDQDVFGLLRHGD